MTHIRPRHGMTLIEVVLAASIFCAIAVLALMVMVSAMGTSEREAAVNRMDINANRALQEISGNLRSAIVPVVTDLSLGASYPTFVFNASDVDENGMPPVRKFQEILNSDEGFGLNGIEWHDLLSQGTDFLPFTVPVDFGNDNDQIDSNFLPELGIITPGGVQQSAADYYLTPAIGDTPALNELRERPMHPYLQHLRPEDFGMTVPAPAFTDVAVESRFAEVKDFSFPSGMDKAYAVMRFSPLLDQANKPVILREKDLLRGDGYDLNGDGTTDDVFTRGRLEILYAVPAGGSIQKVSISGPSVLLQLNTDSPGYKPLFKLVNYNNPSNAPGSIVNKGEAITDDGYAILVQLLLLENDETSNPLAFNRKNGVPYLVRQFQTVVELRNLSRP